MLVALIILAPSCLSYPFIEAVVSDAAQIFTDICDMNSLHGQKRFGTSWSTWSPSMVIESGTSGTGERLVVVPTLVASPSILSPS